MKWLFIFIGLATASCMDGVELRLIDQYPLYHANSSKIWIIHKITKDQVNFTADKLMKKDCIIFFDAGKKLFILPVDRLGDFPERVGQFYLNQNDSRLEFSFPKETWIFHILQQSADKIVLQATPESDFDYNLELSPYPQQL
jgi:hypothetical protein